MKSWEDFDEIVKSSMTDEEYERHILISKISADIIKLRLDKNWTQQELAEKSGLQQSAIARIESEGVLPSLSTLIKILKAFEACISIDPNKDEIITIESKNVKTNSNFINDIIEEMTNNSFYKNIILWDKIFNFDKIKRNTKKVDFTSSYDFLFSTINSTISDIEEMDNYKQRTINKEGVENKWNLKNYAHGLPS
ncbi:MAG: helix-turn-helix domain-containing protein [Bacillota bacterium]